MESAHPCLLIGRPNLGDGIGQCGPVDTRRGAVDTEEEELFSQPRLRVQKTDPCIPRGKPVWPSSPETTLNEKNQNSLVR